MNRTAVHQAKICEALGPMNVGSAFIGWPNVRYLKTIERRWFHFNFISPIMLGIASGAFRNISQMNFFTNFLFPTPYQTSP